MHGYGWSWLELHPDYVAVHDSVSTAIALGESFPSLADDEECV